MDLKKVPVGKNAPYDVNVIIEIPMGGNPGQVRAGQGVRRHLRRSLPAHGDVLYESKLIRCG